LCYPAADKVWKATVTVEAVQGIAAGLSLRKPS
jgi:hypothetical protein